MNLKPIINQIADEADDFLEGANSPEQARAAISEMITMHFPHLSGSDRAQVIQGVMTLLENEGFFEGRAGGGGFSGDDEAEDE